MDRFSFWVRWLKIVGSALVLFGLFMTFFNATSLFTLFNEGIDPVFWRESVPGDGTIAFRTWVYGAWGATIAGWGVSLLFLVHFALAQQERWAWFAIAMGMAVWYVLDTGTSMYFRVNFNVVFNSLILVLVSIPLVVSYRWMRSASS
jgi:hypothetical protein